ncbi:MAG: hypothetical protein PHT07_05275 [Paludibacter sp.]|nr:hypothetical protein [Paludibacter sp.]
MNSTTDKRLISFLVNDDFINYVLNPNLILKELWEDYSNAHPEDISLLDEARRILLGETMLIELPTNDTIDLEKSIFEKCGLSIS